MLVEFDLFKHGVQNSVDKGRCLWRCEFPCQSNRLSDHDFRWNIWRKKEFISSQTNHIALNPRNPLELIRFRMFADQSIDLFFFPKNLSFEFRSFSNDFFRHGKL